MIEAWKLGAEDLSSATLTDRQGRFRIAVQGDEPFELRPGSSAPGGFWSVQATPGADVEIVLTPNLLQGTQPEAAAYIVDPVTGEERVFRPEELRSEQ